MTFYQLKWLLEEVLKLKREVKNSRHMTTNTGSYMQSYTAMQVSLTLAYEIKLQAQQSFHCFHLEFCLVWENNLPDPHKYQIIQWFFM